MRVGLVGAGPWAQLFTGPMLAEAEGIELGGVWARRTEAAEALGRGVFSSYDELLASCDAVAFAVPPDIQADLAIQAARAGKHLLLDKPIALDVAAAEALAEAVAEAGVISQMVLTNRYAPTTRAFLASLTSDIAAVSCDVVSHLTEGSLFGTPWRIAEPHALLDLGPHALDLLVAVAGPVADLNASERFGVLSIQLHHTSGVTSNVLLSAATPGATGALACTVLTTAGAAQLPEVTASAWLAARDNVVQEFVAAVSTGTPHQLDARHGLELQRLLAQVQDAL
jgi:predicted dehydrogenase